MLDLSCRVKHCAPYGRASGTLDFGPGSPIGQAVVTTAAGVVQLQLPVNTPGGGNNFVPTTGPASFGILSGTFAFGQSASSQPPPTMRFAQNWTPAGNGNFNVASTVFPSFTASFDGGADTMAGSVNLFLNQAQLVGGSNPAVLNGTFTLTSATGTTQDFVSSLPTIGSTVPISFDLTTGGPTLAALSGMGVGATTSLTLSGGSITTPGAPVPLPPALYLFGSALGGAFWMSRRKRGAAPSLARA